MFSAVLCTTDKYPSKDECMKNITEIYPEIQLDKYVIMPNHVHAIVVVSEMRDKSNISAVIGQYKAAVTKKIRENSYN